MTDLTKKNRTEPQFLTALPESWADYSKDDITEMSFSEGIAWGEWFALKQVTKMLIIAKQANCTTEGCYGIACDSCQYLQYALNIVEDVQL